MEVKFNGKSISINQVSTEIFASMLDNAAKNINKYSNQLSKVFEDAYRIVLTSRLGKKGENGFSNAGVATGILKNNIKVTKQSVSFVRSSKISGIIRLKHLESFKSRTDAALAIGHDGRWNPSKAPINKIENWIRNKKGGNFWFDRDWKVKVKNKERALARLIVFRWSKGIRKHVLPKWYDVFKNGDSEALNALYKNKTKLENSIKKILNG